MLPKINRLARQQFWQVSQTGQSYPTSFFVLKYLKNNLGYSRWSIVTSVKLAKKATDRNSLRRKIYQALSPKALSVSQDVIIFPKTSMLNLSGAQISVEIDNCLSKLL